LLFNDLYHIQSLSETENQIQATVLLHANHAIFKGHFPGQPVLPGVCMMEMISEITGRHLKQPFRISGAPLIKFLNMIDPQKNPLIRFEINCQSTPLHTTTNGKIFFEALTFMKFQITLVPEMKI
jgi:3-hydroxyacyl-[acyl-carrier-protein] dehydratase